MNPKIKKLTAIAFGAGLLGLCLRLLLYRIGFDEKNILSVSHPLHLACLILTVLAASYFALTLRRTRDSYTDQPTNSFQAVLQSVGILTAACLTALHGLELSRVSGDLFDTLRTILAFGAAVSMILCVLPGRNCPKLHTVSMGIITLFFALDMLCRYQGWSGNPQLPDYVLQIFACVLLTLTSYHRLAFHIGLTTRQRLLYCSLVGLYLCLVCVAGPETSVFFLGGAFWTGACIYTPELTTKKEQGEHQ